MINVSEQHAPRSLIVTFYGAYGRFAPGPVPVAELIRLLAAVGVDAPSVRSSVSRLKRRGLLEPARTVAGAAGYALSPDARQLLDDGDRRVYASAPPEDDGWVLAVFSVPESERQKRHVLRSRLAGLGFGTAAPGVWLAPARLYEETRHTLERLRLDPYVELFRGEHLGFAATADAVARWWDLAAIAKEHEAFLGRHARVLHTWEGRADTPPEEAYRDYLLALDSWRHLPYTDPGLPAALLPEDWPGARSATVFRALHERLRDAGAEFAGVPPWSGYPDAV
ncbi:PaaX family transcriptional regulator [Streptomyces sp. NBC_01007]|nr:PaaX family transcriptional regulator [Streptomyces sp. NBC_01007]